MNPNRLASSIGGQLILPLNNNLLREWIDHVIESG